MSNRNQRILLIGLLIIGLTIPAFLSITSSSSGNIRINSKTVSVPGQEIQAGGVVNLYFGGVTWSGDQVFLVLSQDGSAQITSGAVYTPMISVYDVTGITLKSYNGENGYWLVGSNWINGTIPSTLAVGNYYIKAVDQVTSSVAVTDTYLTVKSISYNATLSISPSSGPGGVPITLTGNGFPPNSPVTISYLDPAFGTWNYLTTTTANASGKITVGSEVPDLQKSLNGYDNPEMFNTVSYRAEIAGITYSYASYNQYARGLKTVGNQIANGLFGNGTNLVSTVRVMVGDTIGLEGRWFHPGVIYVRWDSTSIVGTVTSQQWLNAAVIRTTAASLNGTFNTPITIPNAASGEHYIAVEDSQTRVIVKIFVSAANLQLSPSSGPGGATVQFSGTKYPAFSPVTLSYLDPTFGTWNTWTTTTSDANGQISIMAEMPDLKTSLPSGEMGESYSTVSFRAEVNGVPYSYVDYNEYSRGLKTVGSQTSSYGLFGNGTNLSGIISTNSGNSLTIAGKYFHPGVVYIRFDGTAVVGTVTASEWKNAQILGTTAASSTGNFSKVVTIPTANGGPHYIQIEDSQTWIVTTIMVGQFTNSTPTPSPRPSTTPTIQPTPTNNPTTNPTTNPTSNPTPTATPAPSLQTPTLDVTCKGAVTTNGFKVEINGKLQLNSTGLPDAPILVSYSVTNGQTWESLTMVKTQSDGSFAAVWTPDVSGNYLIKATCEATATSNSASKTVSMALMPDTQQQNVFTVNSNSTITQLAFNSTSKELSFVASGDNGTKGYVSIYIPKTLINDISTLKTYLDGNQISYNSASQGDSWLVSFTYSHSQHRITMVLSDESQLPVTEPEQTSNWLLLVLPVIAVVIIAVGIAAVKNRRK